jgi:hypothetical protein
MNDSRMVFSILLALAVVCLGFIAWIFQHYRPTIYIANKYLDLDPRYIAAAAATGVVTGLFLLGLLARQFFVK